MILNESLRLWPTAPLFSLYAKENTLLAGKYQLKKRGVVNVLFGNGQRACIGQQFAMHEAILIIGMILKHFQLIDHTNYQLKVKETLTINLLD